MWRPSAREESLRTLPADNGSWDKDDRLLKDQLHESPTYNYGCDIPIGISFLWLFGLAVVVRVAILSSESDLR